MSYDFNEEAERLIAAIEPQRGATMTVVCALHEAYEAGQRTAAAPRVRLCDRCGVAEGVNTPCIGRIGQHTYGDVPTTDHHRRTLADLTKRTTKRGSATYNLLSDDEIAACEAGAKALEAGQPSAVPDEPTTTNCQCGHYEGSHETIAYRGDKARHCLIEDCACKNFRAVPTDEETLRHHVEVLQGSVEYFAGGYVAMQKRVQDAETAGREAMRQKVLALIAEFSFKPSPDYLAHRVKELK